MQTNSTGFSILADYHERVHQYGLPLPEDVDLANYWSGIGFLLAGKKYLVSIKELGEILRPQEYTKVPGVKPWLLGISNVRGRLMSMIDLRGFLTGESITYIDHHQRILVVDEDELYSGLLVDGILGLQHFSRDSFTRESVPTSDLLHSYVVGTYQQDGETWAVVSLYQLVDDPKFLQVVKTT